MKTRFESNLDRDGDTDVMRRRNLNREEAELTLLLLALPSEAMYRRIAPRRLSWLVGLSLRL